MHSLYIAAYIFMMLSQMCASKKTSSEIQQQHFNLQQNQVKMMDSLRTLVNQEKVGVVNVSIEGLKKRQADFEQITKIRLKKLEQNINSHGMLVFRYKGSGAVFTRWGREDCPSRTSRLIYSGSAGGSHYNYYGGGASYLCMHHEPQLLKQLSGTHALLYGAEYDASSSTFGNSKLRNGDDMPCAVCQSRRGIQKLMIPARITCSKGWTKQYAGYLATTYYNHKASAEYICMDKSPQASHGGHHNYNGALPYPVKAVCGALPCPPYKWRDYYLCCLYEIKA